MTWPEKPTQPYRSFLIRMWRPVSEEGEEMEWEGEIHHLQANQVYSFHGVHELVAHLLRIILRDGGMP